MHDGADSHLGMLTGWAGPSSSSTCMGASVTFIIKEGLVRFIQVASVISLLSFLHLNYSSDL